MMKRLSFLPSMSFSLFVLFSCDGFGSAHRGRYARNEKFSNGYEIVVPRKVRSDGTFVSHRIPHHFKRSFYKDRGRSDDALDNDDAIHYRLRIENEEHHLELRPNHRLVGPGAVIETHGGSGIRGDANGNGTLDNLKLRRIHDAQCHYHGRVRDHCENSALSTCYGLAGYIRTKRSWYTIEPMPGKDFTKEAEHPHILYKRSPGEFGADTEALCNVTDNMAKTIAKRAFNSRKSEPSKMGAKAYTLELLLVLDKTLVDYHRDFDVENYALTLLNMAAGLLHDSSLGVPVDLSVVRIVRMEVEDNEMSLSINKDAAETLEYFQKWQRTMNPGDDHHPNHHDCAVLIARMDICVSPSLCGFTGTSTIAGTCDPLKGAAIVKDVGLRTGYRVAHHIGHTLGMSHDAEEDNGCPGVIYHAKGYVETTVMHPGSSYVTKKWSKCSRDYLKSYLEAGLGFCLEDEPQDHYFPSMDLLPGVMYNGDDQCRLRYTQDSRECDLGSTCEALRCAIPGKGCVSAMKPPAEGTPCGEKRWCYEMKCLAIGERPGARDGGWGGWSQWSRCSRTCGSGVTFSVRKCNSPLPSNGGAYCRGDRKRHKICATNPCEISAPSFRDVQCAEFNDWIFPEDGKVHRWTAYNLPEDLRASENPCALYCLTETNLVASLRPKVTDGTTCYRGIRDICIGGECKEIPCDLNMGSNAIEDVCGVCKGDSTSCKLKEGTVTFEEGSRPKKLLTVPVGSTNVRVEETEPTKSRILVRTKDGKPLIDGNRLGMFDVPGSKAWLGTIRARQEALNVPGPVTEELVILVVPRENVTIKYSLGLREKNPRKPEFTWDFVDWEKCTASCGPGERVSKPRCVEKIGGLVDERFCKSIAKPEEKVRPCHRAPCLPRWLIGDWQGCASCQPGCEKSRAVKCVRPVGHGEQDVDIIADSYCQGPKPKERESCTARRRREDVPARKRSNKSVGYDANNETHRGSLLSDRADSVPRPRNDHDENNHGDDPFATGGKKPALNFERDANRSEVVIDKEDIKNLTLSIMVERDEDGNVLNFPKNFEPRPSGNSTEIILIGMDAIRYIRGIEEDARAGSKTSVL